MTIKNVNENLANIIVGLVSNLVAKNDNNLLTGSLMLFSCLLLKEKNISKEIVNTLNRFLMKKMINMDKNQKNIVGKFIIFLT